MNVDEYYLIYLISKNGIRKNVVVNKYQLKKFVIAITTDFIYFNNFLFAQLNR